jgi:hypothetical protein
LRGASPCAMVWPGYWGIAVASIRGRRSGLFAGLGLLLAGIVGAQFVSIFVIQPIGAVPDGRTLVITRLTTMHFIDSADGWCAREARGVSLLCRMGVMARVAEQSTILARLPYSHTLHTISTGGKTYER